MTEFDDSLVARAHMNVRWVRDDWVAVADPRLLFRRLRTGRYEAVLGFYNQRRTRQVFPTLRAAQAFAREWLLDHPFGELSRVLQEVKEARGLLEDWARGDQFAYCVFLDRLEDAGLREPSELVLLGWPRFCRPGTRTSFKVRFTHEMIYSFIRRCRTSGG
jgi:hypothetical protein